ncbi:MAG: DUF4145 domain-containing protein [Cyclobacteriaceae bacterium]|nr:DUF4145 domain-containing protein [Cyclobacteriaceae bacterium]
MHHPPTFELKAFVCPHCGVLAGQTWSNTIQCQYQYMQPNGSSHPAMYELENTATAKCSNCHAFSIWLFGRMIFPYKGNVEMANPDLPMDVMRDYNEAVDVANISAKSAAALLRLALSKLCAHLAHHKTLDENIEHLMKRGLPKELEHGLYKVRCLGSHAVAPGVIDAHDKLEVAFALFSFINTICDYFITQPKKIHESIHNLPK